MNRKTAQAIMANLPIIEHFANGGDLGFRLINCKGEFCYTSPAHKITLSVLREDRLSGYVRVKPKYKLNKETGAYERVTRHWPTTIADSEILDDLCKRDSVRAITPSMKDE